MYFLIILLSVISLVTSFYTIKFALIIVKMQETIEAALDTLDDKYGKINEILQKPLFYDSFEVRQVLQEIRGSHDAILIIANDLAGLNGQDNK
tara:strand:- start:144 stop:422 length:279 start_codon:yes stop_codon:yes gene_type:complete